LNIFSCSVDAFIDAREETWEESYHFLVKYLYFEKQLTL
jgi:hypothetical protein